MNKKDTPPAPEFTRCNRVPTTLCMSDQEFRQAIFSESLSKLQSVPEFPLAPTLKTSVTHRVQNALETYFT